MTKEEVEDMLIEVVRAEDPSRTAARFIVRMQCTCNVGVQPCLVHPGRLRTQEERIAFRKAWDERVVSA